MWQIESNIYAPVKLNLLNEVKNIKDIHTK